MEANPTATISLWRPPLLWHPRHIVPAPYCTMLSSPGSLGRSSSIRGSFFFLKIGQRYCVRTDTHTITSTTHPIIRSSVSTYRKTDKGQISVIAVSIRTCPTGGVGCVCDSLLKGELAFAQHTLPRSNKLLMPSFVPDRGVLTVRHYSPRAAHLHLYLPLDGVQRYVPIEAETK